MSRTTPVDLPASVRQRLLNLSRDRGEDFNFVLTRYAKDEDKRKQWTAFLIRSGLEKPDIELIEVIGELRSFLIPPLEAAAIGTDFVKSWAGGGTWA